MPSFPIDEEFKQLNTQVRDQFVALVNRAVMDRVPTELERAFTQNLLLAPLTPRDLLEVTGTGDDAPMFRLATVAQDGFPLSHEIVTKGAFRSFVRRPPDGHRLHQNLGPLFEHAQNALRASIRPDLHYGIGAIVLCMPGEFSYELRSRDAGIATHPTEGLVRASGRVVVYNRPLTFDELKQFEMNAVGFSEPARAVAQEQESLPDRIVHESSMQVT